MQYILYSVIFVYCIPLIGVLFSIFDSSFFTMHKTGVAVFAIIAKTHVVTLRDIFSSIIVPLVTAFSVNSLNADNTIPRQTKILFTVFILIFILSILTHGYIQFSEEKITKAYADETFKNYNNITLYYCKELLTYMALTLGISLKR